LVEPDSLPIQKCLEVRDALVSSGIFRPPEPSASGEAFPALKAPQANDLWRLSPEPFGLSQEDGEYLASLGNHLLAFYRASNQLYIESVRGEAPAWVAAYLDQGKPQAVVEFNRMKRFRQALPGIIRPDLIPTDAGMVATELDAVPGGLGLTAALEAAYKVEAGLGEGLLAGFEWMIRGLSSRPDPLLGIVVSEESRDYRPEMAFLTGQLNRRGLRAVLLKPKDLSFTEEGLFVKTGNGLEPIDILYRFFELFDLKNIPKSELFLYAAKKKRVVMTPPPKAHLEEKSLFALFHHPLLKAFWLRHLGEETEAVLSRLFPKTWVLDPRVAPPHTLIPGLECDGAAVADFLCLGGATQKGRQFVIKPSGFSELAWGSRGVSVGHDLSEGEWQGKIEAALASFEETPYILQKFHKGKKFRVEYLDFDREQLLQMSGRVRLSPYYFVDGKQAHLGGVLATLCSLEKKLIHGMTDAVMAPCTLIPNELPIEGASH